MQGRVRNWFARFESTRSWKSYILPYCIMFIVMFCAMALPFFAQGKDFIWVDDGIPQQYVVFVELGDWMRQFLANIFVTHTFQVPMWSQELGYGQDVLLWISSTLGIPINWLAVFADAQTAQFWLNLTVPITLFLAGLAFSKLGFYHGYGAMPVLIGCMAYLFSGVTVVAYTQIFMIYPWVLAPLMALGADQLIDGKHPWMLVISTALFAFYSFTTLWMACLLLAVYCIVRFVNLDDRSLKSFGKLFVKTLGCVVLGMAIAAVLLLPNIIAVMSMGRVGLERPLHLLYSLSFYIDAMQGLISISYVGSECFIGFLTVSVIFAVALFAVKKDKQGRMLAALTVIFLIIMLIPACGKIMNGFAYPNNRWTWAFALLIGYITMYMMPKAAKGELSQRRVVISEACCFIFFMALGIFAGKTYYLPLILLVALFVFILYSKGALLNVGISLSLVVSCGALYSIWAHYLAGRNVSVGHAYEMATLGANSVIGDMEQGNWRFDALGSASALRNTSAVTDRNGTTFYNSVYNGAIDDYNSMLGLTSSFLNFSTTSLDGRSIAEQMGNVKYVFTGEGESAMAPYLYDQKDPSSEPEGFDIYEADASMPFAVLMEHDIPESIARSLDPVTFQEALLQGVILPDDECKDVRTDIHPMNEQLPFSWSLHDHPELKEEASSQGVLADAAKTGDEIIASGEAQGEGIQPLEFSTNTDVTMDIQVDIPAGKEAYLIVEGVDYEYVPYLSKDASALSKLSYALRSVFPLGNDGCNISASSGSRGSGVWQPGEDAHLYSGKNTWAFCLGTSDETRNGISLSISGAGSYQIGNIKVCVEDVSAVEEAVRALEADGASDQILEGNEFSCSTAANDERTLLIKLPYSSGWACTVDGEPADILNADVGFMAIQLGPGDHDVSLRYSTPGLASGAVISLVGIIVFAGAIIFTRKRRNATVKEERR
ncbi:MAG: YfhO family protein [Eggerthellaceae bacterium]|nr:YfhO family protein [Eggerthellaceae bacterium]